MDEDVSTIIHAASNLRLPSAKEGDPMVRTVSRDGIRETLAALESWKLKQMHLVSRALADSARLTAEIR